MNRSVKRTRSSRPKLSKSAQGRVPAPHDTITLIEESVVWLHAVEHYCPEDLTPRELAFLRVAQRNLARVHRRLSKLDGRPHMP